MYCNTGSILATYTSLPFAEMPHWPCTSYLLGPGVCFKKKAHLQGLDCRWQQQPFPAAAGDAATACIDSCASFSSLENQPSGKTDN